MNTQKKIHPPLRPLYALEFAAGVAGVTPAILQSAIENGDVPGVRILHLGPRKLRHVRSAQFLAWLEGYEAPPAPSLEADRAAIAAVAEDFDPMNYNDDLFN